jgi:hypothetical protein
MDKINLLSLPEKLIAGGGVLMLIASFFDWWHFSIDILGESASAGYDGWGDPGAIWSTLAIIVSLALAGVIIATRLGNVQMPALPQNLTWGQVWGGGAALVAVLMLLKAWRILAAPVGGFGIGFFIGLVAAAAIIYAGYMLYMQEKTGVLRQ